MADEKYSLLRYNIFVNGVPLFGQLGKNIDGNTVDIQEQVVLTQGQNRIEIACINKKGMESDRALFLANCEKKQQGDLYFLGFGVSNYKDSQLNLLYARKDAEDLAALFQKMKGPFRNTHTKIYVDKDVAIASFLEAKKMLVEARPEDTVVVFIGGHGLHDTDEGNTYFFLTYDTDISQLSKTAADFETIENMFQNIAPRSKLLLMDTCESGEYDSEDKTFVVDNTQNTTARKLVSRGLKIRNFSPKTSPFLFDRNRYIFNDLTRRTGAIVFSSSQGFESSFEDSENGNGFFTEAILTAFQKRGADINQDGFVSTNELKLVVPILVSEVTKNKQNPTVDRDNIYLNILFPL